MGMPEAFPRLFGFRNRADIRKSPAAGDIAGHYGQLTGFPDFYRRKLPVTTVRNPIFPIFAIEAVLFSLFLSIVTAVSANASRHFFKLMV